MRRLVRGVAAALGCMITFGSAGAQGIDSATLRGTNAPPNSVWLDSLDLSGISQDWGSPHAGKSVDKNPLKLKGETYTHGVGTHARSEWVINLNGSAQAFMAMAGVDDERVGEGSVQFQIFVDGKRRLITRVMHGGDNPYPVTVGLTGAKLMTLVVEDGGDGNSNDHADWAGGLILLAPNTRSKPTSFVVQQAQPRMMVMPDNPVPAIHGPRVVGATPGRPFLFKIPVTGQPPFTFTARGLPAGLALDKATGIIAGSLKADGRTNVAVSVHGLRGTARRGLTIVGGKHMLALTPPLGWNSWNVWAGVIDQQKTKAAADSMIRSGLADHGFAYINIDDTWEGRERADDGSITGNSKFPDMKGLTDYVHSLGLKCGIYSSPGPKTCAGYLASYKHELDDARTYTKWGFDYLKYDWCSYGNIAPHPDLAELQKPYTVMRDALDQVDRDVVFSFCQYGMGDVWKWGAETGGNCWRTTGDINDSWGSLYSIYEAQDGHEKFAGPGHWNDPDMLVVGRVGWGNPHLSHLRPNEQILHISMWCLLSSPLLIGCDMDRLDPFTVALLSNDEALDINQDPLGKPAGRKLKDGFKEVWSREMFDGTRGVGLCNPGPAETDVTVTWDEIGLKGRQPVRDLWLHKDVGAFDTSYTVSVPAHGCVLLKIGKPNRT